MNARFLLTLRTQPEDPTAGDVLEVNGRRLGPRADLEQAQIVARLTHIALKGRSKDGKARVHHLHREALTQVQAAGGGSDDFMPTISIALAESAHGEAMTAPDAVALVNSFAESLGMSVDPRMTSDHVDALFDALSGKPRRSWRCR